jgi:hypothetical protein
LISRGIRKDRAARARACAERRRFAGRVLLYSVAKMSRMFQLLVRKIEDATSSRDVACAETPQCKGTRRKSPGKSACGRWKARRSHFSEK